MESGDGGGATRGQTANHDVRKCAVGGEREERNNDVARATQAVARLVGLTRVVRKGPLKVTPSVAGSCYMGWKTLSARSESTPPSSCMTNERGTSGDEHEAAHRGVGGQDRCQGQKTGAAHGLRQHMYIKAPLAGVAALGRDERDDRAGAVVVDDAPRVVERDVSAVCLAEALALVFLWQKFARRHNARYSASGDVESNFSLLVGFGRAAIANKVTATALC